MQTLITLLFLIFHFSNGLKWWYSALDFQVQRQYYNSLLDFRLMFGVLHIIILPLLAKSRRKHVFNLAVPNTRIYDVIIFKTIFFYTPILHKQHDFKNYFFKNHLYNVLCKHAKLYLCINSPSCALTKMCKVFIQLLAKSFVWCTGVCLIHTDSATQWS